MADLRNLAPRREECGDLQSFEPLPPGMYLLAATESSVSPNSKGTGDLLRFTFEVIHGDYQGRKVWWTCNIRHTNRQTEEIARREFGTLLDALGVPELADSDEALGVPVGAELKIRPASGDYKAGNEVVKFFSADGPGAEAEAAQPVNPYKPPAAPPKPAAPAKPPAIKPPPTKPAGAPPPPAAGRFPWQ